MAMVGRGCPHRLEEGAARAMRSEIAAPRRSIFPGQFAEFGHVAGEAFEFGIDDRIRSVSGYDAALPTTLAQLGVMRERIERGFGGGDDFDVEALVECPGSKLRLGETRIDVIEHAIGRFGCEPLPDAEHIVERVI